MGKDKLKAKKIFIVDDFEENCKLLAEVLGDDYECSYSSDSTAALSLIKQYKPNLIILDYKMPGLLGVDICKMIRQGDDNQYVPIVFISGAASIEEKIQAFELGADDFVSKPYHVKELLLRIKRLTHREVKQSELTAANLRMNLLSRKLFVDNTEISLTPKQFEILKLLIENLNNLVSRETFLTEVWADTEVTTRNVDSQINYLKKKIERFRGRIVAVPSLGYRLEVDPAN